MPGLRMSIVVSATSFLLGILFTHWIADSLTLWKSPETQTDPRLWTSAAYYAILTRTPPPLMYIYVTVTLIGGLTILWSLRDGEAGNIMFDGGSIFLYGTAVAVYMHSVLPNITNNFTSLPLPFPAQDSKTFSFPPFPQSLRNPTLELASSHLVCSVVLTGVLILQAGRWWAEQADDDDESDEEGQEEEEADGPSKESAAKPIAAELDS